MRLYVGITDKDWFDFLSDRGAEEMNFWRPRATSNFKILQPGDLFYLNRSIQRIELSVVPSLFAIRFLALILPGKLLRKPTARLQLQSCARKFSP